MVGPERLALIKIMEQVASGKIKIVPDFLVTGGRDKGDGNLFNVWMATMLASGIKKPDVSHLVTNQTSETQNPSTTKPTGTPPASETST